MKATDLLIQEHRHVLRALYILEQITLGIRHGKPFDNQDIEDLLEFLRSFGNDHHQRKEEFVFFPALLNATTDAYREKLQHAVFEHGQERSLLSSISQALHTDKKADFVYYSERLIDILRMHIYKEDHILFTFADMTLSQEENENLASELCAFDAQWQETESRRMIIQLSALERRYLKRPTAAVSLGKVALPHR